jgi:hypothetical protein
MERTGFRFSSKMRIRYWQGLFSSVFLFLMFLIPTVEAFQKNGPTGEKFFGLLLLLVFLAGAVVFFSFLLVRLYREKFILEFTDTEIIDRRYSRLTRIPYSEIEVFSPTLDRIFRPNPRLREIQNELEIGDYLMITCRLKESRKFSGPAVKGREYFFSESISPTDFSDLRLEQAMRSGLEGKGIELENLFEVDESQEVDKK